HRRVCHTSEPDRIRSTSPSPAASSPRRASNSPVASAENLDLCLSITQDHFMREGHGQSPAISRVAPASAVSPGTDSRRPTGGSPRSVHDGGSVTCPARPPSHTSTRPAPRRLSSNTRNCCPWSGWNGWVTTTKPKSELDDAALCRNRPHHHQHGIAV